MQNVSNVVEEISFGESVMLFHQNRIFPSTMRKVSNILTEIYLHIVSDGISSRTVFHFQLAIKGIPKRKESSYPPCILWMQVVEFG